MNFKILFILFTVNNLLHHINEKVVIIIFLIIFYFLLKVVSQLIETEYQLKIDQLSKEVDNYLLTLFNILRFYRNFFRRLVDFKDEFSYLSWRIKIGLKKNKFLLKLRNNVNLLNTNFFYKFNLIK